MNWEDFYQHAEKIRSKRKRTEELLSLALWSAIRLESYGQRKYFEEELTKIIDGVYDKEQPHAKR